MKSSYIADINECEDDKQCPGAGEWCVNLFGGFVCCSADSKNPECLGSNSKLDGNNSIMIFTVTIHNPLNYICAIMIYIHFTKNFCIRFLLHF